MARRRNELALASEDAGYHAVGHRAIVERPLGNLEQLGIDACRRDVLRRPDDPNRSLAGGGMARLPNAPFGLVS